MCNIFYSWRRKLGCVTLMMALVAMVLWIKSYYYQDFCSNSRFSFCDRIAGGILFLELANSTSVNWAEPPLGKPTSAFGRRCEL
ncbi:MAG: hypothetical protein JWP89_1946 [Schlesneria sp.]|nr:hypothetical protein [Schlesneria sp.]